VEDNVTLRACGGAEATNLYVEQIRTLFEQKEVFIRQLQEFKHVKSLLSRCTQM
jgi:hypothetical protein